MEAFKTRKIKVVTQVGGIIIESNDDELCEIFKISSEILDIYIARQELDFDEFIHVDAIRNICRCHNLSDDLCSLFFKSLLLLF